MRALAVSILVASSTAVAEPAPRASVSALQVIDPDHHITEAFVTESLHRLDVTAACQVTKSMVAWLVFEHGRAEDVAVGGRGAGEAEACVARLLRTQRLETGNTRVGVVVMVNVPATPPRGRPKVALLEESNRKVLAQLIDQKIATSLGKFTGIQAGVGTSDIERVIHARAGVFRACYQRELASHPDLAGRIVIHFSIAEDGHVDGANVAKSTMTGGSAVESCLTENVLRLKFPASGRSKVDYPFVFSGT